MILTQEKHQGFVDALENLLLAGNWTRRGGLQRLNQAMNDLVAVYELLDVNDQRELIPFITKMRA